MATIDVAEHDCTQWDAASRAIPSLMLALSCLDCGHAPAVQQAGIIHICPGILRHNMFDSHAMPCLVMLLLLKSRLNANMS